MSFDDERAEMVARQLEARGIHDPGVLAAMKKVPRQLFVPESQRGLAYGDFPLPIGEEQTISQPYMVADMTEALELRGGEKVLEIGTGSGYQAAILAELAKEVVSIERIASLAERARRTLRDLGYANVEVKVGDGTLGWPAKAPFQGILVTAGAPTPPKPLLEQLDIRGRLVVPVGDRYSQIIEVHTRRPDGRLEVARGTPCRFVSLIGEHGW